MKRTASFGVASLEGRDKQASIVKLLQRADEALYRAKQAGRNRVEVSSSERPSGRQSRFRFRKWRDVAGRSR